MLFCVVFANELLVVFVFVRVVVSAGVVVGLFAAVVVAVALMLSKRCSGKFCESFPLCIVLACCCSLLLSGVNVVVLTLMCLRLVVCFVVVVITAVSVISMVVVVVVFVASRTYLLWLLCPFSVAVVGCLWCLCRRLRLYSLLL